MTERTYTITVTERQARIISNACELMARIGIGQWPKFLNYLPGANRMNWNDMREELLPVMGRHLTPFVGIDGWYSSLGGGSDKSAPDTDEAFDLNAVIRHRLAWDRAMDNGITDGTTRNWPVMIGVDYDDPMHWGKEPLARIEAVKQAEAGGPLD